MSVSISEFVGTHCIVVLQGGFVVEGTILEADELGIKLQSSMMVSYISRNEILKIKPKVN